eukprot:gene1224-15380_t
MFLRRAFPAAFRTQAAFVQPVRRTMASFNFQEVFETTGPLDHPFKKLTSDYVSTIEVDGRKVLKVEPEGLTLLAEQAMTDIAHLLRPGHLKQLAKILDDPEASDNDRFVALELLKNANVAAGMVLPGCQDTGTAIVMGKRGQNVWTDGNDAEALSLGVFNTYTKRNLRYSQVAPLDMFNEGNTKSNLPAQIDLYAANGSEYSFQFMQTKALLNEKAMTKWEEKILKITQDMGIGAQFGGKYFCHDVRVIRLPRHGASCPVGVGVSCSADRQILGKINEDGIFLEELEANPGQFLPEVTEESLEGEEVAEVVKVDLNRSMDEIRAELSQYLTGTIVVARDIAHAKLLERIEAGDGLPQYAKDRIIYYAGPAKTPEGMPSGSFGPHGGSFISLAKGNRSRAVTNACKKHGGFYLGSIGGPAAILAQNCIKDVK